MGIKAVLLLGYCHLHSGEFILTGPSACKRCKASGNAMAALQLKTAQVPCRARLAPSRALAVYPQQYVGSVSLYQAVVQ